MPPNSVCVVRIRRLEVAHGKLGVAVEAAGPLRQQSGQHV